MSERCDLCEVDLDEYDWYEFVEIDEGHTELLCRNCAAEFYCQECEDYTAGRCDCDEDRPDEG